MTAAVCEKMALSHERKSAQTKNCHCEPVTEVAGVAIRISPEMYRLPTFLRRTDSHAILRDGSE